MVLSYCTEDINLNGNYLQIQQSDKRSKATKPVPAIPSDYLMCTQYAVEIYKNYGAVEVRKFFYLFNRNICDIYICTLKLLFRVNIFILF